MTSRRPCLATKTGNSNISVLTWKNVCTLPTLFKVSLYWNLNYRTQKLLVFVHLWHKEAKVNGFFTISKTIRVSLCIKCSWPLFAFNSYHNIPIIWKDITHTKDTFVKFLKDWLMSNCHPYVFITNLTFAVSGNLLVDRSCGPQQGS